MTFSYNINVGALYRSQIRGYLDDLKSQLYAAEISSYYTEIKSFLTSDFIFRAYNLTSAQYEVIRNAFKKWEEKVKNFFSED